MSIPVELHALADAIAEHSFAYLLTVSDDARPHAVAVVPTLHDGALVVASAGRRTSANAVARSNVSLVYVPAEPGDYSLIIDAEATAEGDDLRLSPTKAVLHRPAPSGTEPAAGSCGSDCLPVSLEG